MLSLFFRVIDPKEEIVFFRRKLYRREDVRTKKKTKLQHKIFEKCKAIPLVFPRSTSKLFAAKTKGPLVLLHSCLQRLMNYIISPPCTF